MLESDASRFLDETRAVEGWFFPIDASIFAAIDEIQQRDGITGNLFEIGVHHGKTALFLTRLLRGNEVLGVCDVFGQQELNVDRSGEGSRELFAANLRRFGVDESRVRIFAKRSQALTLLDTTADCRFFHIDGGHRAVDVIADLVTAAAAINHSGIVAVDDVFNPSWPGVGEGLYRFLAANPDVLVPIVIGGNKVLLARPDAAAAFEHNGSPRIAGGELIQSRAFRFETKEWLGRAVLTAVRQRWVDLDPLGAAQVHLEGWREQIVSLMSRRSS